MVSQVIFAHVLGLAPAIDACVVAVSAGQHAELRRGAHQSNQSFCVGALPRGDGDRAASGKSVGPVGPCDFKLSVVCPVPNQRLRVFQLSTLARLLPMLDAATWARRRIAPAMPVADAEPIYRLVTSVLDPQQGPAQELAALYHERWEIESALDELKTHLRGAQIVLRSKTPDLVRQEFYGLLMAHFAVRALMHEAALKANVDPDRLSFKIGRAHV